MEEKIKRNNVLWTGRDFYEIYLSFLLTISDCIFIFRAIIDSMTLMAFSLEGSLMPIERFFLNITYCASVINLRSFNSFL